MHDSGCVTVLQPVLTPLCGAAKRWGHDSVWLHTEYGNSQARALYDALGYTVAKADPVWFGSQRRVLYTKPVQSLNPALPVSAATAGPGAAQQQAQQRNGDGVFIWKV